MNDFKIGDECWVFYTCFGRSSWENATVIFPEHVELTKGVIVDIDPRFDKVYIYVKGESQLMSVGCAFLESWVFKSKEAAVGAMIEKLEEIRNV